MRRRSSFPIGNHGPLPGGGIKAGQITRCHPHFPADHAAKAKAKDEARARGSGNRSQSDSGRGLCPQRTLACNHVGISQELEANNLRTQGVPFLMVRQNVDQWIALGASKVLTSAITHGVKALIHGAPSPSDIPPKQPLKLQAAIQEYIQQGVIKPLPKEVEARTHHWVPIFPVDKRDSDKVRLITDFRALNMQCRVPKFRAECWRTLLQTLQDPTLK